SNENSPTLAPANQIRHGNKSNYRVIEDGGYNNYNEFIHTHGLKPWDTKDQAEGQAILDAYKQADAQNGKK
ncbi:hypothetical protein K469DRAFT_508697, partial [Zopfia rhizophila CBS 207.26]